MIRLRLIALVILLTGISAVIVPHSTILAQADAQAIKYGDTITASKVKGGDTLVYSFDGAKGDSVTITVKMKGLGIFTFHDPAYGTIENLVPTDINGIVPSTKTVQLTQTGTHYLTVQVTSNTADYTFTLTTSNPNANSTFGFPGVAGVSFSGAVVLDFAPDTPIKITLESNKVYLLNVPGDEKTVYNITIKRVSGTASLGMSILDTMVTPMFAVTMGSVDTMSVQVKFTQTGAYAVGLYRSDFGTTAAPTGAATETPTDYEVTFAKVVPAS